MKKAPLLITVLIFFLTAAGIWYYQSLRKAKPSSWDFVTSDAVFVAELSNLQQSIDKLAIIPSLKDVIQFSNALSHFGQIKAFADNVLISGHIVKRDDFDLVIYANIGTESQVQVLKNLDKLFVSPYSFSKRTYNGYEINEVFKQEKLFFAFVAMDGILIGSNSSFLLEGAVRLRTVEGTEIFKKKNADLFQLPSLASDEGNLYVNLIRFQDYLKIFMNPTRQLTSHLSFGEGSIADLKINGNQVLVNGFVVDNTNTTLSLFVNQRPQPFDIGHLISNKVASLVHYGFSNSADWFVEQAKQLDEKSMLSVDSLNEELKALSIDIKSIRRSVGNQFANGFISQANTGVVSVLGLNDSLDRISIFDELASKISEKKKDSIYIETYSGYEIKLIDQRNFLYQLFYPLAPQMDQTFFVRMGGYMIMADDVELIKLFIDDIDSENTWGKSVDWNKYLESSQQESNVNLFFDGRLVSFLLRSKLNSKWKPFFDSTSLLGIDKGSIQLSRLDENYYLNGSFHFSSKAKNKSLESNLTKIVYDLDSKITHRPSIVQSHRSKEIEILVQDSLSNLFLLSRELKTEWRAPLDGDLVDDIEHVDFYANGKIQYLMSTSSTVYIIDRLGRAVEPFPIKFDQTNLEYSKVIDYDKSKRYRFLFSNKKGDLYLTDKNGKVLQGWNPRPTGGNLIGTGRHYRVLGKDYFIVIQKNGKVHLLNRRGENIKGFPFSLSVRPSGDYYFGIGSNTTTSVSVVSQDGLLIQFGLDGQLQKREVLLKRTGSSQFYLVKSDSENSFAIVRVDPDRIAVLESNGTVMFEFENPGSTQWTVGYLENRLKEKIFCFYDRQQNFSYFFDHSGNHLLNQPVESTLAPVLYYDEEDKKLSVYNVNDSEISLLSIDK